MINYLIDHLWKVVSGFCVRPKSKKSKSGESYFAQKRRYLVAGIFSCKLKISCKLRAAILTRRSNLIFRFHFFFQEQWNSHHLLNHKNSRIVFVKGFGGGRGVREPLINDAITNLWRRVSPRRDRRCWICRWIRCDSPRNRRSRTSPGRGAVPPADKK